MGHVTGVQKCAKSAFSIRVLTSLSLHDTSTCITVRRGLVLNVKMVQISQILILASSFTALFGHMKDLVSLYSAGHKPRLLISPKWFYV